MDSTIVTCTLLIAGLLLTGASSTQADQVTLTLRETAGAARRQEPVTCGVPLPRGAVQDIGQFRLVREADGKEVPAQFRIAGQWWPDPSIRWVWVDFQADLPAKESAGYRLEYGAGVKAEAGPKQPVTVVDEENRWVIDTGTARFAVRKTKFTLFESVEIAGGVQAARTGKIHIKGIGRSATRAVPDPANRGSAHLIYAQAGEGALAEEWTLTFTDDSGRFEAVGSKTGADGSGVGRWGTAFRSRSGRLILNDDSWLVDRQPRQGDRFTFATVPEGAEIAEAFVTENRWLERGPMKCVLEQKGSLGREAAGLLEFTVRYAFYAGSGRVHLAFTLENNDHSGRTESGNVRNADIGTPNTVFFEEMALSLPVVFPGPIRYRALGEPDSDPLTGSLEKEVTVYQDSSGTEKWNRYKDAQFHPRPNSYVSFRGYRITQGQETLEEGRQAAGWLEIAGPQGRAGVTMRDFWQNFPKALTADSSGELKVALFPGQYSGSFALRPGEHKTHDLLLDFSADQGTGPALARAFSAPLLLEPGPEWWAKTEALGPLHPYDPERYPAYEARNLSAIGVYPQGAETGPSLLSRVEEFDFYGWMDYGDVPIDFESGTGQWNLKYDFDYCMLKQYARTGQQRWLNLFRAAARHMGDIDVFHAPHYPELHFLKGGVYAHSLHDEPGHRNPNRNYNHFTRDLAFGARGTAALHYLTGDWKARESCLEIAGNAMAPYMSPQTEPEDREYYPPGDRGTANTLNRLLEAYQLTGDEKYLQRIRWCIKESAFDGRIPPDRPLRVDVWSMTFHALVLARYLELFPDDALARKTFLAHADLMVRSADPAGQKGACYTLTLHPDGHADREGVCSHYNIMISDALAYAFRVSGDRRYLETADVLFPYGVRNAAWENGPATFTHVHSAAGSTYGDVYMATRSPGALQASAWPALPAEVSGWTIRGEDREFDRDNIFAYMNGAGEIYLAYDFQKLMVREYARPQAPPIVAEIYRMASSQDAFGLFSLDRDGKEAAIGQGAMYGAGLLRFWKGNYFARVMAQEETESSGQAVLALGKTIAQGIPEMGKLPDLVACMPKEGLIDREAHYFHKQVSLNSLYFLADANLLNLSEKTEALLARYRRGSRKVRLLLCRYPEAEDARAAGEKFTRIYLSDKPARPAAFRIEKIEKGEYVSVRQESRCLILVFEAGDRKTCEELTESALSRIKEAHP